MTSILGTAAILFVLEDLQFIFGGSPPLLLFLVVIASAAWYGGTKAGLFTTVLSAVTSVYFLTEPYNSFYIARPSEMLRIVTFGWHRHRMYLGHCTFTRPGKTGIT